MAKFYGTKLSDNMKRTPEGYLICFNAVIGRTGYQTYKGSELPKDELKEQNVSVDDDADVKILRVEQEVFKPSALASFEGKPFTFHHPDQLLSLDTVNEHQCGHIQNVRRGEEPLENGDWPLLADIVVTDKETIYAIEVLGIRELSCGYNYHIFKDGNNLLQVGIVGNHVALVENGRAGSHAKINDSKPRMDMSKITGGFLRALGLHSLAKTASPEEFAVALDAAKDTEPEGKDNKHGDGCACPTCKPVAKDKPKAKAKDTMTKDDASQLAGLLAGGAGSMKSKKTPGLDSEEVEERQAQELRDLAEEEEEEGHAEDDDDAMDDDDEDLEGEAADDDDDAMDDDDDAMDDDDDDSAKDSAVESEASPVIPKKDRFKTLVPSATDSAYRKGKIDAIRAMKPFVARSGDKRLIGAMDSAIKQLTSRPVSKGSYGNFNKGAKTRGSEAMDSINKRNGEQKQLDNINAEYRKMRGTNVVKK